MNKSTLNIIGESTLKTIISVIGSAITAILLWIGSTVYTMNVMVEKMVDKIETQAEINRETKEILSLHTIKIDSLTFRVYKIEARK